MKKTHTLAWLASGLASGLALWLSATPAFATSDKDCDKPAPPKIPDGKTASSVDMIGATQRTKLYITSAEAFLECLKQAEDTLTETGRDVKQKRIERKREEATKERDATVAKFNEQVRIYKVRSGQMTESEAAAETEKAAKDAERAARDAERAAKAAERSARGAQPPEPEQEPR